MLTAQGPVRRIHFAPPAAEELTRGSSNMSSVGNARVSVLFANGTFGIWELDARNDLKPVPPPSRCMPLTLNEQQRIILACFLFKAVSSGHRTVWRSGAGSQKLGAAQA